MAFSTADRGLSQFVAPVWCRAFRTSAGKEERVEDALSAVAREIIHRQAMGVAP